MNSTLVKSEFEVLEKLLQATKLPTASGFKTVTADEFMLMSADGVTSKFKHSYTRNYLYVVRTADRVQIMIPLGGPFQMGDFGD